MGRIRVTRASQPQTPTRIGKRAVWAFLPITTSSNYVAFEGGLIQKWAVASPVPSTAIGTGKTGPLRGIKPAASGSATASVAIPVAELNAAFAATGAASVLIVCKSQSSAGHGSSVPAIFELQTAGSSFNHYPYTDGNIYVGPLSATRYLNGTVSGATAGIYDPHVAIATAKSGAQRFYVNGILRGSGSAAETPTISNAGIAGFGEFGSLYLAVFFDYVLSDFEIKSYSANPWQLFAPLERNIRGVSAAVATAALTGTVTTATEANIVTGGKTIVLTLTGDTWVTTGATFDAQRQNIINGIDSAQAEAAGWDAVVKALQGVAGVVRTSDTVVTITLDAQGTYAVTANETITATIPSTALTAAGALVASPTFTVTADAAATTFIGARMNRMPHTARM